MAKALLIDGHNLLWRSYSVPFKFYSRKSTPLHVVTTYLKCIRRSVEAVGGLGPQDSLVVVFDSQGKTANHRLLSSYKSNRQRKFTEDSPFDHLPLVQKMLEVLSIPFLEAAGVEADDVIAGLTNFYIEQRARSFIVSADSDYYQLLSQNVSIVHLGLADHSQIVDEMFVVNRLGVLPHQYVLFKSLVGDKADDIAGVPGVGPVTARKILNGQKDLDLEPYRRQLLVNRWLIQLTGYSNAWTSDQFLFRTKNLLASNSKIFEDCEF